MQVSSRCRLQGRSWLAHLAPLRGGAQHAATAATRWPDLGCSGSMSTGKPCARRTAEVVGPIDPTTTCSANAAAQIVLDARIRGDLKNVLDLLARREQGDADQAAL